MTEYIVVGISHSGNGSATVGPSSLLCPQSQIEFARRITPRLSSKSLILMESFYHKKLIHPGKPAYEALRKEFGLALGSTFPVFGGFDCRVKDSQTARVAALERLNEWNRVCNGLDIKHPQLPITLREMSERLAEIEQIEIRSTPKGTDIELARWMRANNRRFDQEYIDAARKLGSSHDVCAIVVGGVHAFSLAQKVPYPVEYMEPETPASVKEVYYGYLADYVLPSRLIEQAKTA